MCYLEDQSTEQNHCPISNRIKRFEKSTTICRTPGACRKLETQLEKPRKKREANYFLLIHLNCLPKCTHTLGAQRTHSPNERKKSRWCFLPAAAASKTAAAAAYHTRVYNDTSARTAATITKATWKGRVWKTSGILYACTYMYTGRTRRKTKIAHMATCSVHVILCTLCASSSAFIEQNMIGF